MTLKLFEFLEQKYMTLQFFEFPEQFMIETFYDKSTQFEKPGTIVKVCIPLGNLNT